MTSLKTQTMFFGPVILKNKSRIELRLEIMKLYVMFNVWPKICVISEIDVDKIEQLSNFWCEKANPSHFNQWFCLIFLSYNGRI